MDAILLAWLQAKDGAAREHLFAELILAGAAPIIKQVLWVKLGFRFSQAGGAPNHADADDLYHEIVIKLVQRLHAVAENPESNAIRNFRQFAARVATNACHDYLRAKSPARARLKNSLHDLLDRHRDFELWRTKTGTLLCGFAAWKARAASNAGGRRLQQLEEHPEQFRAERFARENLQQVPRGKLIAEILNWVDAPIELDALVAVVALLLEVKDKPFESLDEEDSEVRLRLIDPALSCDTWLVGHAELQLFWQAVCQLPLNLRTTVCLGFADENGEDLLSLLLDAGGLKFAEIAASLEIPPAQLQVLWAQAPLAGDALAAHLGVTRRQVNRWRHRAWQLLAQRLGKEKPEN